MAKVEARQLGSLHERMAYVGALMLRDGSDAVSHDLWVAIYDLQTLVKQIPDVAFHKRTDLIVPAAHRYAKRGLPSTPELADKGNRFINS